MALQASILKLICTLQWTRFTRLIPRLREKTDAQDFVISDLILSSYLISSRSLLLCIEEASLGNSLRGGFLLATEFCWLSLALVSLYLVSLNLTPFFAILQNHSIHVFGAFTALNLKSGAIPEANPILGFRDLESLVRLKSNITRRARRGAEAVRLVHWVPPQRCPWRTSDPSHRHLMAPCRVWQFDNLTESHTYKMCKSIEIRDHAISVGTIYIILYLSISSHLRAFHLISSSVISLSLSYHINTDLDESTSSSYTGYSCHGRLMNQLVSPVSNRLYTHGEAARSHCLGQVPDTQGLWPPSSLSSQRTSLLEVCEKNKSFCLARGHAGHRTAKGMIQDG